MKYMLGANYWGRRWGTEMWLHYDKKEVREELKQLSEWGVRCLRVFPNWRDFQPVEKAYAWQGTFGEYVNSNSGVPVYDDGVDEGQIENFRDFCRAAGEFGIELVVSIVTGWMSGKLFTPPVLNGKNLITDPEALMWMRRFIHRFVSEFKNERCIISWDLGNECNCLGRAETEYEAYNNILRILCAYAANKRQAYEARDIIINSCTNQAYITMWNNWLPQYSGGKKHVKNN